MAAQVVKDLLSTTSLLFDKSDALNDELQKLVRSAQRSSTQKDQEELTKVVVAGLDTSSVSLLATTGTGAGAGAGAGAGGEAGLTVLQRALADCESAASSIKKLHENRDAVVDARAEAIKVQEQLARDKAKKLADEVSQSTKTTDTHFITTLRGLVNNSSSSSSSSNKEQAPQQQPEGAEKQ